MVQVNRPGSPSDPGRFTTWPIITSRPPWPRSVLPVFRRHDLRHSLAMNSAAPGEHYMKVSKWLGPASVVRTLSVYAGYI